MSCQKQARGTLLCHRERSSVILVEPSVSVFRVSHSMSMCRALHFLLLHLDILLQIMTHSLIIEKLTTIPDFAAHMNSVFQDNILGTLLGTPATKIHYTSPWRNYANSVQTQHVHEINTSSVSGTFSL